MTTCNTCSRSWSSLVECHCSICHEHFSTVWGFDLHKPNAEIGCLDPGTITTKNGHPLLSTTQRTEGPVWVAVTRHQPEGSENPPPDQGWAPLGSSQDGTPAVVDLEGISENII